MAPRRIKANKSASWAMMAHRNGLTPTVVLAVYLCGVLSSPLMAQVPPDGSDGRPKVAAPDKEELSAAPEKVDINPVARDEEISKRLQLVLNATGWFTDPQVRVDEGVVFLSGQAESEELKKMGG